MTLRRFMLIIAAVAVLAAAGRFGLSENMPAPWAPLPFAVMFPLLWIMEGVSPVSPVPWIAYAFPLLAGPVLLFGWHPRLLAGTSHVPLRTFVGLAALSGLTAIWFVGGWGYGLRYQGPTYFAAVACANIIALAACWSIVIYARRKVSFEATLFAHASVALWLTWMAFPWLGELP